MAWKIPKPLRDEKEIGAQAREAARATGKRV